MNLSSIYSRLSTNAILSFSFIAFLIWKMVTEGVFYLELGILIVLILAANAASLLVKAKPVKRPVEPGPVIVVEPISEDAMFFELSNVLTDYNLELRLRRIEDGWNVTLLQHTIGLTRMVGVGSGKTISDALVKAEADFLEKVGS